MVIPLGAAIITGGHAESQPKLTLLGGDTSEQRVVSNVTTGKGSEIFKVGM